ncbi:winged helix-turn-helix domain-containing protein, partial [Nocardioides marmotae]|uniref:winged helix-turn-helix domain-containing protein n=1 Tax=Nocardioides marmotae TaxID=2663857 RepID=UPI0013242780
PYQQPYQPPAAYEPPPVQQPPAPQTYQPAPTPAYAPPPVAPAGGAHAAPAPAPAAGGPSADGSWVRFNGLALNNESRVVTVGGGAVDLNRTEFDLLASLLGTGRRVRSKADLVLTMRGQQYVTSYFVNEADKRSVEVHISNLRRKLGDDGAVPRFIETVRGVGYRLAETA